MVPQVALHHQPALARRKDESNHPVANSPSKLVACVSCVATGSASGVSCCKRYCISERQSHRLAPSIGWPNLGTFCRCWLSWVMTLAALQSSKLQMFDCYFSSRRVNLRLSQNSGPSSLDMIKSLLWFVKTTRVESPICMFLHCALLPFWTGDAMKLCRFRCICVHDSCSWPLSRSSI